MRDGDSLVGWGMATGVWEAMQMQAAAQAVLTVDGKLTVGSATADIGTGTYTIMTQIAAETARPPDRGRDVHARRLHAAQGTGRGRLVHGGVGRLGGQGRLREGSGDAVQARRGRGRTRRWPTLDLEDVQFTDRRIHLAPQPDRSSCRSPRRCSAAESTVIEEQATVKPRGKRKRFGSLHPFGDLRRGEGRRAPRHGQGHARRRRRRGRADPEPEDSAEPGPRRGRLGHGHGPGGGERPRPRLRPVHDPQPGRLPRRRQRRRA